VTGFWTLGFTIGLMSLTAGDRVLLIGDSQAFLLSHEFPVLATRDGVTFKAVVAPGSSVISWASDGPLWAMAAQFRPTAVLVSLGSNDAYMGPSVVRNEGPFLARVSKRLDGLGAREVVWLGPPKLRRAAKGLEAFVQMVSRTGFRYLDAREIEVGMWDDQLHCSRPQYAGDRADGCRVWATWAWQLLVHPAPASGQGAKQP